MILSKWKQSCLLEGYVYVCIVVYAPPVQIMRVILINQREMVIGHL